MNKHIVSLIVATAALVAVGQTVPQSAAQDQALGLADIKMLAKNGVSDDIMLSQIRNSHTVYRLSAAEIIDLKDTGVSQKVIDFMINTPSTSPGGPVVVATAPVATPPPPPPQAPTVIAEAGSEPPPPVVETVVVSPGPGYVWVSGYWRWYSHRWVWMPGAWVIPPRHGAVWVGGHWERRWGTHVWVDARWH